MCLGIPGRVCSFVEESDQLANVDVAGVERRINIGLVAGEGLEVGSWVLIHMGFVMSILDEDEAAFAMDGLRMLGEQLEDDIAVREEPAIT